MQSIGLSLFRAAHEIPAFPLPVWRLCAVFTGAEHEHRFLIKVTIVVYS